MSWAFSPLLPAAVQQLSSTTQKFAAISESASSGEVYNATVTSSFSGAAAEPTTAAESSAPIAQRIAALTETLTAADAQTVLAVLSNALTETATAADATDRTATILSALTEALTLLEAQDYTAISGAAQTETNTATETSSEIANLIATITEALTLADSQQGLATLLSAIADALTAVESLAASSAATGAETAPLTVMDVLGDALALGAQSDEAQSGSTAEASQLVAEVSGSDSSPALENITAAAELLSTLTEALTLASTELGGVSLTSDETESQTIVDAQSQTLAATVQDTEAAGTPSYAVFDEAFKSSYSTISNGGLTLSGTSNSFNGGARATTSVSQGVWYWEVLMSVVGGVFNSGVVDSAATIHATSTPLYAQTANAAIFHSNGINGFVYTKFGTYAVTILPEGGRLGLKLDMAAGTIEFFVNGVSVGAYPHGLTGALYPATMSVWATGNHTANYGRSAFAYSVPVGANAGVYLLAASADQDRTATLTSDSAETQTLTDATVGNKLTHSYAAVTRATGVVYWGGPILDAALALASYTNDLGVYQNLSASPTLITAPADTYEYEDQGYVYDQTLALRQRVIRVVRSAYSVRFATAQKTLFGNSRFSCGVGENPPIIIPIAFVAGPDYFASGELARNAAYAGLSGAPDPFDTGAGNYGVISDKYVGSSNGWGIYYAQPPAAASVRWVVDTVNYNTVIQDVYYLDVHKYETYQLGEIEATGLTISSYTPDPAPPAYNWYGALGASVTAVNPDSYLIASDINDSRMGVAGVQDEAQTVTEVEDFSLTTNAHDTEAAGAPVYATWDPAFKASSTTLSNGDLTAQGAWNYLMGYVRGTRAITAGKWYWEITTGYTFVVSVAYGIVNTSMNMLASIPPLTVNERAVYVTSSTGEVFGFLLDQDAGTLSIYRNGALQLSGAHTLGGTVYPYMRSESGSSGAIAGTVNFGQSAFVYPANVTAGVNAGVFSIEATAAQGRAATLTSASDEAQTLTDATLANKAAVAYQMVTRSTGVVYWGGPLIDAELLILAYSVDLGVTQGILISPTPITAPDDRYEYLEDGYVYDGTMALRQRVQKVIQSVYSVRSNTNLVFYGSHWVASSSASDMSVQYFDTPSAFCGEYSLAGLESIARQAYPYAPAFVSFPWAPNGVPTSYYSWSFNGWHAAINYSNIAQFQLEFSLDVSGATYYYLDVHKYETYIVGEVEATGLVVTSYVPDPAPTGLGWKGALGTSSAAVNPDSFALADDVTDSSKAALVVSEITEALTAGDSAESIDQILADAVEAGVPTDVVANILIAAAAATDTLSADTTQTALASVLAALTESGTATDVVARLIAGNAAQTDTNSATDTATVLAALQAAITEALTATDPASALSQLVANITNAATGNDALLAVLLATGAVNETATANDNIISLAVVVTSGSDSATATDTVWLEGAGTEATASDALTATDAYQAYADLQTIVEDVLAAGATETAALILFQYVVESGLATEANDVVAVLGAAIAETVTTLDQLEAAAELVAFVNEASTSTDLTEGFNLQTIATDVAELLAANDITDGTSVITVAAADADTLADMASGGISADADVTELLAALDEAQATYIAEVIATDILVLGDEVADYIVTMAFVGEFGNALNTQNAGLLSQQVAIAVLRVHHGETTCLSVFTQAATPVVRVANETVRVLRPSTDAIPVLHYDTTACPVEKTVPPTRPISIK